MLYCKYNKQECKIVSKYITLKGFGMRTKKLNGLITFRFDLTDENQKSIYFDLVGKKAPVREYIIVEILKKYYFKKEEDRISILEDRLLNILDNISEGSIQKKVVQFQSPPEIKENQTNIIKKDIKLNLDHIGEVSSPVDEKKKYDGMLEKVYKNSFINTE